MSKWIDAEQAEEFRQLEQLLEAMIELLKQGRLEVLAAEGQVSGELDEPARIVNRAQEIIRRKLELDSGRHPDPTSGALRPRESRRGARPKVVKIRRAALVPVEDGSSGVMAG